MNMKLPKKMRWAVVQKSRAIVPILSLAVIFTVNLSHAQNNYNGYDNRGYPLPKVSAPSSAGAGNMYARQGIIRMSLVPRSREAAQPDPAYIPLGKNAVIYIVKRWDTLWDIARQYLSDPFKWSQVWNNNPHITNPDLIYPGDSVAVPDFAAVSSLAASAVDESQATSVGIQTPDLSLDFLGSRLGELLTLKKSAHAVATARMDETAARWREITDKLLKPGILFTTSFLKKVPQLWYDTDAKGLIYPGDAIVEKSEFGAMYQRYDEVIFKAFGSYDYKVGDTVDFFHVDGLVMFRGKMVNCIWRTGHGRVTAVDGKTVTAQLFDLIDVVQGGDRVGLAVPLPEGRIYDSVEPSSPLKGSVFKVIESSESQKLFNMIIIDLGSADGVQEGDLFSVRSKKPADSLSTIGFYAAAVSVADQWSTLTILQIFQASLVAQDTVERVKRIRYK